MLHEKEKNEIMSMMLHSHSLSVPKIKEMRIKIETHSMFNLKVIQLRSIRFDCVYIT